MEESKSARGRQPAGEPEQGDDPVHETYLKMETWNAARRCV